MTQAIKLTSGAKAALAFAAPAVATDDVRPFLIGALFGSHNGKLAAVGTDGHFVAVACAGIAMPTAWADVILPPAALKAATHKTAAILETDGLNLEFLSRLAKGLKTALKLAGKKGVEAAPFMRFHMLASGGYPNSALLRYETVADDAAAVEFEAVVMRARV